MSESNNNSHRSEDKEYDYLIKIMMIGDSCVGKQEFITTYIKRKLDENRYFCTIGIDYLEKIINRDNKIIKLQIWDTSGQERYRNIAKSYFYSTNGFIIAYDIGNKKSFDNVKYWIEQIKSLSDESTRSILIGTNCETEKREVTKEEGINYAKINGMKFFETSAKLNINVKETFECLVDEILLYNKNLKKNDISLDSKKMKKQKKNKFI